MLAGKKVYVFATRGGIYAGTALDSQTTYVLDCLNFLGMSDVEFVYAEGLNISGDAKEKTLSSAKQRLIELAT